MERLAIERIDGKIVVRWPVLAAAVAVGGAIATVIGLLFSGASYYMVAVPVGLALVVQGIVRNRREADPARRRSHSDGKDSTRPGDRSIS